MKIELPVMEDGQPKLKEIAKIIKNNWLYHSLNTFRYQESGAVVAFEILQLIKNNKYFIYCRK